MTADQRGHGVGVAINDYARTTVEDRAIAAGKLEDSVLKGGTVILREKLEKMEYNGIQPFSTVC